VQEVDKLVIEINQSMHVLSMPPARQQPPDVDISVQDLFTILGFGESAYVRIGVG
jgi:hypothetical protein